MTASLELDQIRTAADGTHHVLGERPLYSQRYRWVLNFHPPGLAAAGDDSGAFHIDTSGRPAYDARFARTFGFYDMRAAVRAETGLGHVDRYGKLVYPPNFSWVGNFQEARCAVRTRGGDYYHISVSGAPTYSERYGFAGDYRERAAVVRRSDGFFIHIDLAGRPLNGLGYLDLDVFHKGYARARDRHGWFHTDRLGRPAYESHFAAVEPFYNGEGRVVTYDGLVMTIDETGKPTNVVGKLSEPTPNPRRVESSG
jgi:hypothetical protein